MQTIHGEDFVCNYYDYSAECKMSMALKGNVSLYCSLPIIQMLEELRQNYALVASIFWENEVTSFVYFFFCFFCLRRYSRKNIAMSNV